MIKVGDRVKFVSSTGAGIVKSIKNGIAYVDVDGFEIPVMVNEVVLAPIEDDEIARKKIAPDGDFTQKNVPQKRKNSATFGKLAIEDEFEDEPIDVMAMKRQFAATQKALVPDQKPHIEPIKLPQFQETDYVVKLVFVPTSSERPPQECDLDLYLVNDSTYELMYAVGKIEKAGYVTTIANGKIEEDTKIILGRFKRLELNNIVNLKVNLFACKSINYTMQENIDAIIELHPLKFVRENNYVENDYFDEKSYCITLADNTVNR